MKKKKKVKDKWWEAFDKLVNQGNLDRDEWENHNPISPEEEDGCHTDQAQDKRD